MTTFKLAPLQLIYKDLIVVKISATNQIGDSIFSEVNQVGLTVQTEPLQPPNPLTIIGFDEQSIQLQLDALTGDATGGSTILYYAIEWDVGSAGALWNTYATMTADSYFASVSGLTSGHTYRFRYKA